MINVNQYTKSKKLQDAAFVQLLNPETNEPEVTESGQKVGVELYSIQSKEFKRALRSTAHLGLSKKELEKQEAITKKIAEGVSASENDLDFLDECEEKTTKRMQFVFAKVTTKLHNIQLPTDFAEENGIAITKQNNVRETVDNIHKLYIAFPDLSKQIGDAIADKKNFINA